MVNFSGYLNVEVIPFWSLRYNSTISALFCILRSTKNAIPSIKKHDLVSKSGTSQAYLNCLTFKSGTGWDGWGRPTDIGSDDYGGAT